MTRPLRPDERRTRTPEQRRQDEEEIFRLAPTVGFDRIRLASALGLTYRQLDARIVQVATRWRAERADYLRERHESDNPAVVAWKGARRAALPSSRPDVPASEDRGASRAAAALNGPSRAGDELVVELTPLPRVPVTAIGAPFGIVFADPHAPLEDARALGVLYHVVERLRPRWVCLDGDAADMLALSRYPKDARAGKSWPLSDEQRAVKSIWRTLAEIGAAWGLELFETEANHSGNALESRFRRYLNDRNPELFTLEGIEELLTYQRFFHPADVPVQLVDELVVCPGAASPLRILHGYKALKYGAYTARATGEELDGSVMIGHTHRQGYAARRSPAIVDHRAGRVIRAEGQHRAYEVGCTLRIPADYAPRANCTQGFAIVGFDEAAHSYGVELVTIIEGAANVAALGETVRA